MSVKSRQQFQAPGRAGGKTRRRKAKFIRNATLLLSLMLAGCSITVPLEATAVGSPPMVDAPTVVPQPTETPGPPPTPAYDPFADSRPTTETSYRLPPGVQHVTGSTAQLHFELTEPQAGMIVYRPVTDVPLSVQTIALDASTARHEILIKGLMEGTMYELLVRLGDGSLETMEDVSFRGEVWGRQSFRTPPYGPLTRFAVIGDSGFGEQVTVALGEQIASYSPDFMLLPGDLVYRAEEEGNPYDAYALKYFTPFAAVLKQAPIYTAVGNHEINDRPVYLDSQPFYYYVFPPLVDEAFPTSDYDGLRKWYAFAVGDVQFISLDTQTFFGDPGHAEQLAWLEERLSDPRFAYSIPFFHVPPFSNTFHLPDAQAVRGLVPIFERNNVPLVLAAHDHDYARFLSGSVNYVVSGGGSQSLYSLEETDPHSQIFVPQSHFLMVEISADEINLRAIAVDGSIIEEFSILTPR